MDSGSESGPPSESPPPSHASSRASSRSRSLTPTASYTEEDRDPQNDTIDTKSERSYRSSQSERSHYSSRGRSPSSSRLGESFVSAAPSGTASVDFTASMSEPLSPLSPTSHSTFGNSAAGGDLAGDPPVVASPAASAIPSSHRPPTPTQQRQQPKTRKKISRPSRYMETPRQKIQFDDTWAIPEMVHLVASHCRLPSWTLEDEATVSEYLQMVSFLHHYMGTPNGDIASVQHHITQFNSVSYLQMIVDDLFNNCSQGDPVTVYTSNFKVFDVTNMKTLVNWEQITKVLSEMEVYPPISRLKFISQHLGKGDDPLYTVSTWFRKLLKHVDLIDGKQLKRLLRAGLFVPGIGGVDIGRRNNKGPDSSTDSINSNTNGGGRRGRVVREDFLERVAKPQPALQHTAFLCAETNKQLGAEIQPVLVFPEEHLKFTRLMKEMLIVMRRSPSQEEYAKWEQDFHERQRKINREKKERQRQKDQEAEAAKELEEEKKKEAEETYKRWLEKKEEELRTRRDEREAQRRRRKLQAAGKVNCEAEGAYARWLKTKQEQEAARQRKEARKLKRKQKEDERKKAAVDKGFKDWVRQYEQAQACERERQKWKEEQAKMEKKARATQNEISFKNWWAKKEQQFEEQVDKAQAPQKKKKPRPAWDSTVCKAPAPLLLGEQLHDYCYA